MVGDLLTIADFVWDLVFSYNLIPEWKCNAFTCNEAVRQYTIILLTELARIALPLSIMNKSAE